MYLNKLVKLIIKENEILKDKLWLQMKWIANRRNKRERKNGWCGVEYRNEPETYIKTY